jgi:formate hydrogenlyase subunit 3/multisubunit Na+/H+ antiporter MnhD subunit
MYVITTVFDRSNTGVVGSNPTRGMDVCVYSVFVLACVGSGLATGWSPVQVFLPIVYNNTEVKRNLSQMLQMEQQEIWM